jgi:hypothetical protein
MTTRPDPVPVALVSDAFKEATLSEANSEFLRKQLAAADTDPVPAALFEAALRVHRGRTRDADYDRLVALRGPAEEITDTAERLIRQAVAGGVREESAG